MSPQKHTQSKHVCPEHLFYLWETRPVSSFTVLNKTVLKEVYMEGRVPTFSKHSNSNFLQMF